MPADHDDVAGLAATADRLTDLAEVAELMGDDAGALGFRRRSSELRARAMDLLDAAPAGTHRPEDGSGRGSSPPKS